MNTEHLAQLKLHFHKAGVTQSSIAEAMGTSTQYISGILNGKLAIGKKTAARLQELYGVSSAWILTGQGRMFEDEGQASEMLMQENLSYRTSIAPDAEERIKFLEEQVEFYKKQVEILQKLLMKDCSVEI